MGGGGCVQWVRGLCGLGAGEGEGRREKEGGLTTPERRGGITEEVGGPAKRRRSGASAEKQVAEQDVEWVCESLGRVLAFARLERATVREIASRMLEREVKKDELVIREGASHHDELFLVKRGHFHVTELHHGVQVRVNQKRPGDVFGEIALMYNAPRSASVFPVEDSTVYVLQRATFRKYVREAAAAETSQREVFLNSVPILSDLTLEETTELAQALEEEHYPPGSTVVQQGDTGDRFYIVMGGEVEVWREDESGQRSKVNHLFRSDFFGEHALISNEPRAASVYAAGESNVLLYSLHQKAFVELLLPLQDIMERAKSDAVTKRRLDELAGQRHWTGATITLNGKRNLPSRPGGNDLRKTDVQVKVEGSVAGDIFSTNEKELMGSEQLEVELDEGRLLGGGASSVVVLATEETTGKTFALKRMKKTAVMTTPDHVFCEQAVTRMLSHPYCMRQYASFKDESNLYFLFDHLDGCDLMDALAGVATVRSMRPPGRPFGKRVRVLQGMSESDAVFYVGCLVLACEYIHSYFIVYRDMKPENVFLDSQGYPMLGDFGFAKNLERSGGRTYTFCGTPGYVAPEVVLARGYATAVDWWGLGVLTYVLLSGQQPFNTTTNGSHDDALTVMKRIVDQKWNVTYPWYMSAEAEDLISHLLERRPAKRLGNLANKANDIKRHSWFQNFDWNSLIAKKMSAPQAFSASSAHTKRLTELANELEKTSDECDSNDPDLREAKDVFASF
jgi:cGMP-dependent protein kinase 2